MWVDEGEDAGCVNRRSELSKHKLREVDVVDECEMCSTV